MSCELLVAVDIRAGRSARLGSGPEAWSDPATAIADFRAAGAQWIHLVDLDLVYGTGDNFGLLEHLMESSPMHWELSGGIDTPEVLDRALATRAERINLATTALRDRAWVARVLAQHADRVAVCLDVDGARVVARGAGTDVGELREVIDFLDDAGARRYIVTDRTRDGALAGANLELLERVAELSQARITASGGMATLDDLRAVRELSERGASADSDSPGRVDSVIIGKAFYEGNFTVAQALAELS
ncbi:MULTISPECIES: HisA/HisF-related TIM barrel protein [Actinotignum]|uniref:HisA/HisF-related TIM barrel protein n=1 Tax=Actinotignum timonense TaxID=1870995 RepID=A0AAW9HK32_9ACTO|nr:MULTISPECIES: HisA/HisF-related TIM barrel protein [Actinotignum]MDE1557925.1 HisA/HisF-related TIM barrel protein [Actinotignum schaalii]MDE1663588.1 HisA/HisF-related TIM barrel protein [Actinotignum schaalii]MDK6373143.1 HisA/HisF-related TIM barrel protein [Actinotignum timonense]MDK6418535.1 HisA/HisF-related TIM barrel protein [Actinotignum timonense]MDK6590191.1 HisA/HisF-related TIM barrel protein [Actinotignum timonense]